MLNHQFLKSQKKRRNYLTQFMVKLWNPVAGCCMYPRVGCVPGIKHRCQAWFKKPLRHRWLKNRLQEEGSPRIQCFPLAMCPLWETKPSIRLICLLSTVNSFLYSQTMFSTDEPAAMTASQICFIAQWSAGREEKHACIRRGWRHGKGSWAWQSRTGINELGTTNAPKLWGAPWPHCIPRLPKDIPQSYLLNNGI